MRTKNLVYCAVSACLILTTACKKDALITTGDSKAEEAFPGQIGEAASVEVNNSTIYYNIINGKKVFEGDIMLTEAQLKSQSNKTDAAARNSIASKWPNNTVYYSIDPALTNQQRVTDAIAHWTSNTTLNFVVRTNQVDYIYFLNDGGCYSDIGRSGGAQIISLGDGCSTGNAIHEIGHAIGLFHEQSRTDRNSYINILTNNIMTGYLNNFQTYVEQGASDGINYSGFDFGSIMMYGSDFFSSNGQPTITKKDGSTFTVQRNGLSPIDINCVAFLYPHPSQHLYIMLNSRMYGVSEVNGSHKPIGGPVWTGTEAVTSYNGFIYAVQNSRLYKIDKNNGQYTQLGGAVWAGTEAMTVLNNYLYIVENSRLYRVDPSTGAYTQIGGAVWAGTEGITSISGMLYLIENSRLYRVDPSNGSYVQLGGVNWPGTEAMTSWNGMIYAVENSRLYKINPADGSYVQLGGAVWAGTNGMTTYNNMLYIVENSRMYRVDPSNGSYTQIGNADWPATYGITSL